MTESTLQTITAACRDWRSPNATVDEGLRELLFTTDSRAVGLWRLEESSLALAGFQAKPDMPADVSAGFAKATKQVPLDQTGLGIVKAVINRGPAVAHVDAGKTGLADSASWLAKFEAEMSLAVPILAGEEIIGVLAMSTANPFQEDDETWQLLMGVAKKIGESHA